MQHDADHRHRRSLRLPGYDYHSANAYFVTLCTRQRECLLDDPIVTEIITKVWSVLPVRFPTIALDEFAVMPNHVHLIVWLRPPSSPPEARACVAVASLAVNPIPRAGASPASRGQGPAPAVFVICPLTPTPRRGILNVSPATT